MGSINSEKENVSSKYFPGYDAKIIIIGREETQTNYICGIINKVAPLNEVFAVTASCVEDICYVFHEDTVLVYCAKIAKAQEIQTVVDDCSRLKLPILVCVFGENISKFENTYMLTDGKIDEERSIFICFDTFGDELSVLASELKLKHIILRKLWL